MSTNKQQTAIDWLMDCFPVTLLKDDYVKAIFKTAKEKEKQQIIEAFNQGFREGETETMVSSKEDVYKFDDATNYYNETFKTK